METIKLNAQGVSSFLNLISSDVAKEIETAKEKNPDQVGIGDGFSVYGLYDEQMLIPLGALAVQESGYSVMIRSLYIVPEARERGGANMLLAALVSDCLIAEDITEIELIAAKDSDIQMETVSYLKRWGFESEDAVEKYYRTTVGDILTSGVLDKAPITGVLALKEVDDRILKRFGNDAANIDIAYVELPIVKEDYDTDVSTVSVGNDELYALVLVVHDEKGLIVQYVYAKEPGRNVVSTLKAAVCAARDKYGDDTPVRIPTVNEAGSRLAEKIAPSAKVSSFIRCFYPLLPVYERIFGGVSRE